MLPIPRLYNEDTSPENPQYLLSISLLANTGKLSENLMLRTIQRYVEERDLLNSSQFDFETHHSISLQHIRLMDHVTLNFKSNMPTAAVFLDIEKIFNTT
jgi:hypothetical protein